MHRMLDRILATHPDTAPGVLAVVAGHTTDSAIRAYTRLRLGDRNPLRGVPLKQLTADVAWDLFNHPNITASDRSRLVRHARDEALLSWMRSPHLTPDDLARVANTIGVAPRGECYAAILTHPNTPRALAHKVLERYLLSGSPRASVVLAAIDYHYIDPRSLDSMDMTWHPLDGGQHATLRAIIRSYLNAGSLQHFLTTDPSNMDDNATWYGRTLTMPAVAECTPDTDLARALATHAVTIGHTDAHRTIGGLLVNPHLDGALLNEIVDLTHGAYMQPYLTHHKEMRRRCQAVMHAHPDHTNPETLNTFITRARTWEDVERLVTHPGLTGPHLTRMHKLLVRAAPDATQTWGATVNRYASNLARIALHPHATNRHRTLIRENLATLTVEDNKVACTLTQAALTGTISRTTWPASTPGITLDQEPGLRDAVNVALTHAPTLLTDPETARVALHLDPAFNGTLTELETAATGVNA